MIRAIVSLEKSVKITTNVHQRLLKVNAVRLGKVHESKCYGFGLVDRMMYGFSEGHKYQNKTTKEIEKEIAMQKWKDLQNTFKSLGTNFGLKKPTIEELNKGNYFKPSKIEYNLESLRDCSKSYPVYLYYELSRDGSPFNEVIEKVIDNLWKAEKKEAMEFLEFLYVWDYKQIDVKELYERVIDRFDMDIPEMFEILKKFEGKLSHVIELKVLKRLHETNILSSEYSSLLRIVNYFTVKDLLSEEFYEAIAIKIKENINRIPPTEALEAYIYFTFNINEHNDVDGKKSVGGSEGEEDKESNDVEKEDLGLKLIGIIERRILSEECIRFLNGDQIIGLLHTYIKNNLILNDDSDTKYYKESIDRILNRVEIIYISEDFSSLNKEKLLEICYVLPEIKRQTVIALVQREVLKKKEKFDYDLVPSLYLVSYENNMITDEIKNECQKIVLDNIYHIGKDKIAKILWLFTLGHVKNINLFHEKVEVILNGGFREFSIKDVCVIVWSMCAAGYNQEGSFWGNVEAFLVEELNRKLKEGVDDKIEVKEREKVHRKLVNECCWILWAYHNNRFLKLKTLDLIASIIIEEFGKDSSSSKDRLKLESSAEIEHNLTTFELTSIISFFYSIDYPSVAIASTLEEICLEQFSKIHMEMDSIELCKCLKYIGVQVWRDLSMTDSILSVFELELEEISYRDIMPIVAILLSSGIKNERVVLIIKRLLERKKNLEALGIYEDRNENKNEKKDKNLWGFKLPF